MMQLRIGDLAAENCAMFMWVTGPFMLAGIRLLRAYGFHYKNVAFTWIKTNKKAGTLFTGMGHYTRSNPEFVLLGMRGRLERQSASVHSVLMAPMTRHSVKPPEIHDRILELFGDLPRLELYARTEADGWDQTGLELNKEDVRDFIEKAAPLRRGLSVFRGRT